MGRRTNLVCSASGLFAGNTSGDDGRDDSVDDDFVQLCQNYMTLYVRIGKIDRLRLLLNA